MMRPLVESVDRDALFCSTEQDHPRYCGAMMTFKWGSVGALVALACDVQGSALEHDVGVSDEPRVAAVDPLLTHAQALHAGHALANRCVSVRSGFRWLTASEDGQTFAFRLGGKANAARFFMKASDLATYLLYDSDRGYLVSDNGPLLRQTSLLSDVLLVDDSFVSGAEWQVSPTDDNPDRFTLFNRRNEAFLTHNGLSTDPERALSVEFIDAEDCAEHPELSLDATGTVAKTTFDDGTLYGIAETHTHLLSNFGFGGGGIFHGSTFHRLGVEHALSDCSVYHGENGRKDVFGFAFDTAGADAVDFAALLPALLQGELPEDNHLTPGYPDFPDWPSRNRSTHQTQYYRWLERAYLAGLRLVVQHATTNSVICELTVGEGLQSTRYACDDMVAVDRIIEETYAMERYIDAQSGGPGLGWFRIVQSPQEARAVIASGKLAVILGIETSNLFNCALVPRDGGPTCNEDDLIDQLDHYHSLGVRALFPVHKFDNAFSAGDGDRGFIEIGNYANSGHFSNFTEDCPEIPSVFDKGDVVFGGLNEPRDDYDSPPPNDVSDFLDHPARILFRQILRLLQPALEGDFCQNAGLTPLGQTLIEQMMARGMIIEIDHLPRHSYQQTFNLLEAHDYPAVGSHGNNYEGQLYDLGGISKINLGRCRAADRQGAMVESLLDRIDQITTAGAFPAEGFGFDLNGFASAPRPRFGDDARCDDEQTDPITYPFDSHAGDITFTPPFIGNRALDFNTEGLAHIGLLPELIEDARRDAVSPHDLDPLFRSAEGYLRMWEKAEARSAALRR